MSKLAPPIERPKQYQSDAAGALELQRDMMNRELAMMPLGKVGTPAWSRKQQEIAKLDMMLRDMRRWG